MLKDPFLESLLDPLGTGIVVVSYPLHLMMGLMGLVAQPAMGITSKTGSKRCVAMASTLIAMASNLVASCY